MKFLHYKELNQMHLGVKTELGIISLERLKEFTDAEFSLNFTEIMARGKSAADIIQEAINGVAAEDLLKLCVDDAAIEYAPAVIAPPKILCIGLNYYAHGKEIKMKLPETPTVFSKYANALAAHNEQIELPMGAEKFDYEAELVIVIGKGGKNISAENALSHVFGYTAGNDFSARDLQMLTGQWLLGKSCDGFAPLGPWVVTADEIPNPNALNIGCKVNGKLVQSANTDNMIFSCADIVSYISRYITLQTGDIIFTGTPSGVILGKPPEMQNWLKSGDEVEVFIEKIGSLKNKLL